MLWRALLAFLALPGIVAIAVPAWYAARALRAGGPFHAVGLLPLVRLGARTVAGRLCVRRMLVGVAAGLLVVQATGRAQVLVFCRGVTPPWSVILWHRSASPLLSGDGRPLRGPVGERPSA